MDVQRGLRHPTMVLLIGCCVNPPCLVYELMPQGSLYDRLICDGDTPPLPWHVRFDIFEDTVKALIHLHNRCHSRPQGHVQMQGQGPLPPPHHLPLSAACLPP